MKKDTFTLRKTFLKPIANLDDAQLGRLFKAIYQYQCGLTPELTDDIAVHFSYFEAEFKAEEEKRRSRAEKAAERRRKKLEEAKPSVENTPAAEPEKSVGVNIAEYDKKMRDLKLEYANLREKIRKIHPKIYKLGLSKLSFDDYSRLRCHITEQTFKSHMYELAKTYDPKASDMTYFQAMMQYIIARKLRS